MAAEERSPRPRSRRGGCRGGGGRRRRSGRWCWGPGRRWGAPARGILPRWEPSPAPTPPCDDAVRSEPRDRWMRKLSGAAGQWNDGASEYSHFHGLRLLGGRDSIRRSPLLEASREWTGRTARQTRRRLGAGGSVQVRRNRGDVDDVAVGAPRRESGGPGGRSTGPDLAFVESYSLAVGWKQLASAWVLANNNMARASWPV